MANTFKVVTFAAEPNSAGTPYIVYTAGTGVTTVVLGLILTNIHTAQVTAEVELVSDTTARGGALSSGTNTVTNGTAFLAKDIPIPVGSSVELLSGNKVVLETTDILKVSASGATDVALSIMEIT